MDLVHELIAASAGRFPERRALTAGGRGISYRELWRCVAKAGEDLRGLGLSPGERVAVYLEKRIETVAVLFAAAAAGGVFVPINPQLRPRQVAHILNDCGPRVLVTSSRRLRSLAGALDACPALRHVLLVDGKAAAGTAGAAEVRPWEIAVPSEEPAFCKSRAVDIDLVAILYTSGSTGRPKGVCLSHRNLVAGARSVARYLENSEHDRILAALPLGFDAGFSQLTTAFSVGAEVVLMNYLFPKDAVSLCADAGITGITGVPSMWNQLAQLDWPREARSRLRYFANTGGRLPRTTLTRLRTLFPQARPYLMYGLTEAFRSTYLDPEEIDRRPDSIGKAIPNAEVLVVNEKGGRCGPGEEGELVHRGPLVALGYWNDAERSAERFRPAPGRPHGLPFPEKAVWSGDTVRMDAEGFLYFVGRRDDMIKTSGYRVSPTEVEEVAHDSGLVGEAAAVGLPDPDIGQAISLVVTPRRGQTLEEEALLRFLRSEMPLYMVPRAIVVREALPYTSSGKVDRQRLALELAEGVAEAV